MIIEGKTVLITGASRGIGAEIARCFANQGAILFLNARNIEQLNALKEELEEYTEVSLLPFDVSDVVAVKQAFRTLHNMKIKLDVLVNNAGILNDALIGMVTKNQIEKTFGINTFSMLYTIQYASRMMQKSQSGSIINISSIIGTNGNTGQAVYGASKAAVVGLSKSLSKELAPSNIRVNVIAPGFIDTDMTRALPKDKFDERMGSILMGRIGTPKDIANVALFLASDMSSYVTGQTIGVDGGMLI